MQDQIPARDKIPHRAPIAMVDSILTKHLPDVEVSAVIREDNCFVNSEGLLDGACIPELVSQAAAAVNTCRNQGKCRSGMLALGRGIKVFSDIRVNDEIIISGKDENPMDNWYVITFAIRRGITGEICAEGEVSICVF